MASPYHITSVRLIFALSATSIVATSCGNAGSVTTVQQNQSQSAFKTSAFRDGRYSADGLYGGQPSRLTVTIELRSNRITDVTVGTHATNPTSLDYQRRFAAAVPAVVIGKRLDEVKVGKLAGSSGCPDGFNAALARIMDEAVRR